MTTCTTRNRAFTQQEALAMELLKQSAITPAVFTPSKIFLEGVSVGIYLGETLVFMTGEYGDMPSTSAAECLCVNRDFLTLVQKAHDTKEVQLSVRKVQNDSVFTRGISYTCIAPSEQGAVESGSGEVNEIFGVFPNNSKDLAFGMCVSNSVMMVLAPDATPLQTQIKFM